MSITTDAFAPAGPFDPDVPAAYWKNLGDRDFAAGNLRGAAAHYEQALRLRPDFGLARHNLGIVWQHLGEWARAERCFQQAICLMPACAAAYNGLGSALKEQGDRARALAALKIAVELDPANPVFAYNLGTTLHEGGELDKAAHYYRQALRLNPGYADASNNLATALKEQGSLDEAIARLQDTLELRPDHAAAYYSLSDFAAAGRYQFAPDHIEGMKNILSCGQSTPAEQSLCGFALGTALNQQGSYDEAFRHYQQANDLRKRLLKERGIAFDAQSHGAMVDRMIAQYDRSYFAGTKGWGRESELPVFIIGMPRSGSTLVEQILASHPRVFGAGEIGEIRPFIAQLAPEANAHAAPLPPDRRAAEMWADAYLQRLAGLGLGASRVTVKTLQNFLHLGIIATLFPRARIVHCRRDSLDVCLSCYFTNFQINDFSWSLEDIGAYYRAYEKLMAHWTQALPMRIHEVCYEDLVHDQETVSRKLLDFCGVEWNESCLEFFNTSRVVHTASKIQVRKPISAQAIGRWMHYRAHLEPLFKALGLPVERKAAHAYPVEAGFGEPANVPNL
jgi:tetratricopeptide (TPR) repeat protein